MEHQGKKPEDSAQTSEVDGKPSMTMVELLIEALNNAQHKALFTTEIFMAIQNKYPYYRKSDLGWKITAKRHLISKPMFIKQESNSKNEEGYWKLSEDYSFSPQKKTRKRSKEDDSNLEHPDPGMSYMELVIEALNNAENKLSRTDIAEFVLDKYPFFESKIRSMISNIAIYLNIMEKRGEIERVTEANFYVEKR